VRSIGNWLSNLRVRLADRRANVTIIFAIAIIPIFGAMGIAVDYSMANSARTNMQASLDATGIALQRLTPLTQTQMNTIGSTFFFGNLGKSPLTNISVAFTPGTGTITLDATGTYNTGLASVLTLIGMPTTSARWRLRSPSTTPGRWPRAAS
jgi:Flp pilus assembly protein TadG